MCLKLYDINCYSSYMYCDMDFIHIDIISDYKHGYSIHWDNTA